MNFKRKERTWRTSTWDINTWGDFRFNFMYIFIVRNTRLSLNANLYMVFYGCNVKFFLKSLHVFFLIRILWLSSFYKILIGKKILKIFVSIITCSSVVTFGGFITLPVTFKSLPLPNSIINGNVTFCYIQKWYPNGQNYNQ